MEITIWELKLILQRFQKDYNDKNVPDIDSTSDNKNGEDDIDDAPVLLSVATGHCKNLYWIRFCNFNYISKWSYTNKKYVL